MTERALHTFRSSTLGWLRGTLADWGTTQLMLGFENGQTRTLEARVISPGEG